ncbi:hypothetical protein RND71_030675 [Anisodus tanguticus]|uniref:Uncharacterized protein n=1 Tax=Anisodus tanguticus TaxID=243964 RepID=A0AAE1RIM5_9SOLA|nr:hypothetical protein RND71_030675 [Anisodus tanguticus]
MNFFLYIKFISTYCYQIHYTDTIITTITEEIISGAKRGSSPIFDFASATPVRKTGADDFLNADNDKNECPSPSFNKFFAKSDKSQELEIFHVMLLTPPGTPLFPSLEMESQKTVMSQLGTPKARPTALKSRVRI